MPNKRLHLSRILSVALLAAGAWSVGCTSSAPPTSVSFLTATAGVSSVILNWDPPQNLGGGSLTYSVERGTSSGSEMVMASNLSANTYTDSTVSNGTTYFYTVVATVDGGNTPVSSEVASTPSSSPLTTAAFQADNLVDSVGINSDLCGGLSTTDLDNVASVSSLIGEAGIRHVRDGWPWQSTSCTTTFNNLYDSYGVRNLAAGGDECPGCTTSSFVIANLISIYPHLDGVEGPNEPDTGNVTTGQPLSWVANATTQEQVISSSMASLPAYAGIPSVCSPLAYGWDATSVSYHAWSSYCSIGNGHNYPPGINPENNYGTLFSFTPDGEYAASSNAIAIESGSYLTGQPFSNVWQTETGWCTGTSNNNATWLPCAPDSVIAKYMPRLFLYNYAYNHAGRTYYFRSTDDTNFGAWATNGLIESDGQTVKPQYTALKSLISVLTDPGVSFTPGNFHYSLSGSLTNVDSALFQKRNGSFYLALWLAVPSWTAGTPGSLITVPNQSVNLNLGQSVSAIQMIQLDSSGNKTTSSLPVQSSVPLSISDSVTLIELDTAPN